jgi:hypothetical protein
MTRDERMFNSFDSSGCDKFESITFVDNGKSQVIGHGKIAI